MNINPIETIYNNYRFRSRLEARHAVLFDTLGIAYEYESQDYLVNGTRYLPDFWLPKQQCFIEIKGQSPTHEEQNKCALLALTTGKPVYLFHGSIWIPGVDDTYTEYYDDEKQYMRGTFNRGAYAFDPSCISLTIDDTSSDCYGKKCIHDEYNENCPSHLEMYYPGTPDDQHHGDLHIPSSQGYLLRAIYIADMVTAPGDSCKLRLDAHGCLQYLYPTYRVENTPKGKVYHYRGRKPIRLPATIQENKKELERLLARKSNTWEWGIGNFIGTIFVEDMHRWRECSMCHQYWITKSERMKDFPCYDRHVREWEKNGGYGVEHPDFIDIEENEDLMDRTDKLIEAYTAARQARFEHGERGIR